MLAHLNGVDEETEGCQGLESLLRQGRVWHHELRSPGPQLISGSTPQGVGATLWQATEQD